MLSPEMRPQGLGHVLVGENSRTVAQRQTEGLKRLRRSHISNRRVLPSASKFPHARCSNVVTLDGNRDYNPCGTELVSVTSMKVETANSDSRSMGQVSILIDRWFADRPIQRRSRAKHFSCIDAEIVTESFSARGGSLEKDQALPEEFNTEDKT